MKVCDGIFFSILVPVYNAEQFLAECIESALNQTYKNFEIVLVDDGSTDTSGAICDQYAAKYNAVSAYHTENGGELRAREYAMQKAQGDFFICLDSDDRLRNDALEIIKAAIEKYQCDCVIFGYARLVNETLIPAQYNITEEVLSNKRDIYMKCLDGRYNSMCMKAIKATVHNKPSFDKNLPRISVGGDLIQSLSVFKNSEKIAFIEDALYEYRDNQSSISYTVSCDAYRKSMGVNEMVYHFLQQENVFSKADFEEFRVTCMEKHVNGLLRICNLKITNAEKIQLMQKMRNTEYFQEFVNKGTTIKLSVRHRIVFLLNRWKLDYFLILLAILYGKL